MIHLASGTARPADFQERLTQVRKYCDRQQVEWNQTVSLISGVSLAIFTFIAGTIYANPLIALPCAIGAFYLALYLEQDMNFPFNPYQEVTAALDTSRFSFNEEFSQFAYDRDLFLPETILETYRLFQEYVALRPRRFI